MPHAMPLLEPKWYGIKQPVQMTKQAGETNHWEHPVPPWCFGFVKSKLYNKNHSFKTSPASSSAKPHTPLRLGAFEKVNSCSKRGELPATRAGGPCKATCLPVLLIINTSHTAAQSSASNSPPSSQMVFTTHCQLTHQAPKQPSCCVHISAPIREQPSYPVLSRQPTEVLCKYSNTFICRELMSRGLV